MLTRHGEEEKLYTSDNIHFGGSSSYVKEIAIYRETFAVDHNQQVNGAVFKYCGVDLRSPWLPVDSFV